MFAQVVQLLLLNRAIDIINCKGIKTVLGQYELFTDRNITDYLVLTIGNEDPMHGVCIPHSIARAWEQQGCSKDQIIRKRVARNLGDRNVGAKGKNPKIVPN